MSNSYFDLLTRVVRQPRHPATGAASLRVLVLRGGAEGAGCEAELVDLSRGGCRLSCEAEFQVGEAVVVRLEDPARGLSLSLPGAVRWRRQGDPRGYSLGCRFDADMNYEQLGELFLEGFLATDDPE